MGKKYSEDCRGGENCYNDEHLCKVAGKKEFDRLRELVRDARFFCRKCGRAAHSDLNLCKPEEI